ncbi:MAG: ThuA domain-containing protein [Planctomycetota bacterium]|nr:ThuA domain-containing protein [Planctomycetota bacterium]
MRIQSLHCVALAACVLTASASFAESLVFKGGDGPGKGKRIVLISGDEEYRSEEAVPMLGKILSQRHGFTCTVLFSLDPNKGYIDPNNQRNLPGLEALDDADLMIVATRFRTPSDDQMKPFAAYLAAGKPVIGLRTATHGFQGKWSFFGRQILGEQWVAHHGGHKREGCRGVIEAANAKHPVLNGVKDVFAPSDVYTVKNLTDDATILLRGAVTETLDPASKPVKNKKNDPMMALAWLRDYKSPSGAKGKAFCTTMGASVDLVSNDARRIVVNAAYHLTGLDVPEAANVEFVDPFYPSFYGFIRDKTFWAKRNLHPEDFGLGKSPVAVDPPGTPNWPFRKMGPSKK